MYGDLSIYVVEHGKARFVNENKYECIIYTGKKRMYTFRQL